MATTGRAIEAVFRKLGAEDPTALAEEAFIDPNRMWDEGARLSRLVHDETEYMSEVIKTALLVQARGAFMMGVALGGGKMSPEMLAKILEVAGR